jgi:hypothetical protein
MTRETTVDTAPATVHALVNDFRNWAQWSPWEEKDPDLTRTFSGAERGAGSEYAWTGNKAVGTGEMTIVASSPERIEIDLEFIKPFKASNKAVFTLTPERDATQVSWTMSGSRNLLMDLAGRLFVDRALGKDFDQGLAKLKAAAEVG